MDQCLEEERKRGQSYFSGLPQDLTLRYLPLWLNEVNSNLWTRPLRILEEREEPTLIRPDGYALITTDNRRYLRTAVGGYRITKESGEAILAKHLPGLSTQMERNYEFHLLPNESIVLSTGELITPTGVKKLWMGTRQVLTNRRNEIYVIQKKALEIFSADGQRILEINLPEKWKPNRTQLVDRRLYMERNGILSSWDPFSPWYNLVELVKCTKVFSHFFPQLISDHRQYWIVLVNVRNYELHKDTETPVIQALRMKGFGHALQIYNLSGQLINELPLDRPSDWTNNSQITTVVQPLSNGDTAVFPRSPPRLVDAICSESLNYYLSLFLTYSVDGYLHLYYPDLARSLVLGPV